MFPLRPFSRRLTPPRNSTGSRRPRALAHGLAVLGFIAASLVSGFAAQRQDEMLAAGWKFTLDPADVAAPTVGWKTVTIPHTWNTKSADMGNHKGEPHFKDGYYRGVGWYARALDLPAALKGRRVFIRFEAASLVAKAYLNGHLLGEHRGAFTAFAFELTLYVSFGGINELRVEVDNSHQPDVPPLSGDFNIDGGIYRPVHLIVTDPVCISPMNFASPGVYVTTKSLTAASAVVAVNTLVSNGGKTPANIVVQTTIADATGKIVVSAAQPALIAAGETKNISSTVSVPSPHRWNGRKDPYLYAATATLRQEKVALDAVTQPLGLRTVAITESQGFLLNEQPYPIHGVNRHQDWGDQGWAATPANDRGDMQMMLDMGVTAIRLTHYPQSDLVHDLADHSGLLLWNEVSLVNMIATSPAFATNAEQQLRELILQRFNHPSVAFWGLFNELGLHTTPPPDDLLKRLKTVVQELDPSRLIVAAIYKDKTSYNLIPDHPAYNRYPGWYQKIGLLDSQINGGADEVGKRIAISEYGAGSNTSQHQEGELKQTRGIGATHPEEWQTRVHEVNWAGMKENPLLWGTFIWVMFDFQVSSRNEGGLPALNDKGLVTQDRKIKKDSYFFYQANWTNAPMVRIASHRMTPRKQTNTAIEVFSNCSKVELSVNGKTLAPVSPDDVRVFRWPHVILQAGRNVIKAVASNGAGAVTDTCEWIVDPVPAASSPTPPSDGAH